ncbi:hypothetical protein FACS189472_15360 [Alphaproteobacteria bacterium]|nr:hypothetical protein FACS189472_15360 [Alphaproteobacteria bacterium]
MKKEVKLKGVSTRGNLNQHINEEAFNVCLKEGKIVEAENYVLRNRKHEMTMQLLRKTGLSGVMTKAIVLPNQACLPFIYDENEEGKLVKASRYVVDGNGIEEED